MDTTAIRIVALYQCLDTELKKFDGGWHSQLLTKALDRLTESYMWAAQINTGITEEHQQAAKSLQLRCKEIEETGS